MPDRQHQNKVDEWGEMFGLYTGHRCRELTDEEREAIYLEEAEKRQSSRFRYFRERDRLVRQLTDYGWIASVTLDGSVIITGKRA